MPSNVNQAVSDATPIVPSAELATAITSSDFCDSTATVIGYGNMGRQFVKALRALGVRHVRVCSRSEGPLQELQSVPEVDTIAGGFEELQWRPEENELAIVTTPTALLINAAEQLVSLGFHRLLIE